MWKDVFLRTFLPLLTLPPPQFSFSSFLHLFLLLISLNDILWGYIGGTVRVQWGYSEGTGGFRGGTVRIQCTQLSSPHSHIPTPSAFCCRHRPPQPPYTATFLPLSLPYFCLHYITSKLSPGLKDFWIQGLHHISRSHPKCTKRCHTCLPWWGAATISCSHNLMII